MTDQPDLSTLPQRMRYAAEVIAEAGQEYHNRPENMNSNWLANAWDSRNLRYHADQWEGDAIEAAERDALVEELAKFLAASPASFNGDWEELTTDFQGALRAYGRRLIESGWRKGDPA